MRCPVAQPGAQEKQRASDTVTETATANSDGPASGASKLLGLELIRFACAMTVLIFHFKHFALTAGVTANTPGDMPLARPLSLIYIYGFHAVQVFWCISGFIFYWKYADALATRRIAPKRFFWLRFSRLYPLHLLTLLFVAGLQPIYSALAGQPFNYSENSATRFILQLFLADQWGTSHELSFNGPIWSVSAEVLVYVAFFMIVRAFGKLPWVIAGAICAGLWSLWNGNISPVMTCGGYFFAGGAAALWLGSGRCRRRPDEARRLALAMIGACIIVSYFVNLSGPDVDPLATWIMAVTPPLLLLAAQDLPALNRWQNQIRAAGNLTYSTYLIHFPVQLVVATAALAAGITLPFHQTWFLLAYVAAVILIGRIVFVRFEAPMQAMIRAATLSPSGKRAAA
jgi:peptidoglycan/LPS O-acetylase OafA/YrhL